MKAEDSKNHPYFPPDLAALLGIYWCLLPIAFVSSGLFRCILDLRKNGNMTLFWIAIALGIIGTVLLFLARLPLYRQRRFLEFGPRGLDESHRRLYRWAWRFAGAGIGLLVILLAVMLI